MTDWTSSPDKLILAPNEIHIWRARIDLPDLLISKYRTFLSSEEIDRAERFVFAQDRSRFIVARGILRELLGKYLAQSPESIPIQKRSYGKPFLGPQMGISEVFFNVSHSGGLALFGFSSAGELGVDVERIQPDFGTMDIAKRYFSKDELQELRELPPELQPLGFFCCWTRKEAYVKASGKGLSLPLDTFSVSLTPGKAATLNSVDRTFWSLYSINPGEGFVGACVSGGGTDRIRFFGFGE